MSSATIHVTPLDLPGCDVVLSAGESDRVGLAILAAADNVRAERERLGVFPDPLAPVTVRVWHVTPAGTYLFSTMREHVVRPQSADSEIPA